MKHAIVYQAEVSNGKTGDDEFFYSTRTEHRGMPDDQLAVLIGLLAGLQTAYESEAAKHAHADKADLTVTLTVTVDGATPVDASGKAMSPLVTPHVSYLALLESQEHALAAGHKLNQYGRQHGKAKHGHK